mgnify:CR=1 FL=1
MRELGGCTRQAADENKIIMTWQLFQREEVHYIMDVFHSGNLQLHVFIIHRHLSSYVKINTLNTQQFDCYQ